MGPKAAPSPGTAHLGGDIRRLDQDLLRKLRIQVSLVTDGTRKIPSMHELVSGDDCQYIGAGEKTHGQLHRPL
jgi:hypothetical protein